VSGPGRLDANQPSWPSDKLAALRLGRRLVAELTASQPGRRAFVDITPQSTASDAAAHQQGWTRTDHARAFRLEHWEYDADRITGHDYDIGAVLVRAATATNESHLITTLQAWDLNPSQFLYAWQTDDPT
jgi:hypothetical protein